MGEVAQVWGRWVQSCSGMPSTRPCFTTCTCHTNAKVRPFRSSHFDLQTSNPTRKDERESHPTHKTRSSMCVVPLPEYSLPLSFSQLPFYLYVMTSLTGRYCSY